MVPFSWVSGCELNKPSDDVDDGGDDNYLNYRHWPDHTMNTRQIDTIAMPQDQRSKYLEAHARAAANHRKAKLKEKEKIDGKCCHSVIIYRKPFAFLHWHCLYALAQFGLHSGLCVAQNRYSLLLFVTYVVVGRVCTGGARALERKKL